LNFNNLLPWQIAPLHDKSPIVLLAGPKGTGKTQVAAEKIHGYMMHYPDSMGLMIRKTRESMINSTVLFMERMVIDDKRIQHNERKHRWEYPNGSILAYGGMKDDEQREAVRGVGIVGGIDFAWMEEAIRFAEDDFQEVTTLMRGHSASWQQIIVSTNPGPPSHWINQRLMLGGEASIYDKARPEDNIHNPPAYIEGLKRLTGILRQRLYEGKWVQAEGLVYGEFDLDNLTDEDYDPDYPIELGIDDGYIDPRAILFIQRKPDRIIVFDEMYHSRHLAETCVNEILDKIYALELGKNAIVKPRPPGHINTVPLEIAIIPPEAKELQQRLRLADIVARSADNAVIEGINKVRPLIMDGNGYRTLRVNRRCKSLVRELTEGYIYPDGARRDTEKPEKGNDHAADALRYWVSLRGK
jgi:phage terminase large subunit